MTTATAEVIEMSDQLIIKEFGIQEITEANLTLMKEQILEIPEKPETKDQYDTAYRFNVDAKKLLPRIEERRKELKAPVLERGKLIDQTAKKAVAMVQPLIELSGTRREAWEEEKAREKAEKERQEAERLAAIQIRMDKLNVLAGKYMEYNRPAADLEKDLANLEAFEVSAVDFQERAEKAEEIKAYSIQATKTALENRKAFEAEQARQEEERRRMAEEQAKADAARKAEEKRIAAERAKLEAERKAQEEAAAKKAAEIEKNRLQEEERIRLEREALEKEKAEIEAKRQAEKQYLVDWDEAIAMHTTWKARLEEEMDLARADAQARWEATEKAKQKALEREKLLTPDKMMATTIAYDLDEWISGYKIPILNTAEMNSLTVDMIARIKTAIHTFETEAGWLV